MSALTTAELARIIRDNIDRILVFSQVSLNGDHAASVLDTARRVCINGDCVQLTMMDLDEEVKP